MSSPLLSVQFIVAIFLSQITNILITYLGKGNAVVVAMEDNIMIANKLHLTNFSGNKRFVQEKGEDAVYNTQNTTEEEFNEDPTMRIVGGTRIKRAKFRKNAGYSFLVPIFYWDQWHEELVQWCAGSLVAPNVVLTAGHCAELSEIVQVGSYKLYNEAETSQKTFDVVKKVVHPKYDDKSLDFDFALLKLSGSVHTRSVRLASKNMTLQDEEKLTIMGWGQVTPKRGSKSSVPRETNVRYMTNEKCSAKFESLVKITSRMICAEGEGRDACQGDSGGPLFLRQGRGPDNIVQVGIVSWGFECASPTYPGVYSRVSKAKRWIKRETRKLSW